MKKWSGPPELWFCRPVEGWPAVFIERDNLAINHSLIWHGGNGFYDARISDAGKDAVGNRAPGGIAQRRERKRLVIRAQATPPGF